MESSLAFVWAGLIAFAILAYVVLDGFDLGVGLIFPMLASDEERSLAMNTVAPVWDGNETWLVLGGGGLFAVFPLAYAIVMPALYTPIIAMLIGLIFRGVAFEYRWRTGKYRYVWDWAFFGGSLLATSAQGIALGALVQGIAVEGRAYAGGNWDWLTPFSVLTGVALSAGYLLLGSTWLIMKTTGPVREFSRELATRAGLITLLLIGMVSLITPMQDPVYFERWFTGPTKIFSFIVPALILGAIWLFRSGLKNGNDNQPFLASLALFVLCYIGIGISFYPYIVPPSVTIWQAAAPDSSLGFLLAGAAILIPIILGYTAYSYWVFRGKLKPGEGYH